jgi:hypothetical protein
MSCSPVKLVALQSLNSLPSEYPMYTANLQASPETAGSQHSMGSQCYIPQNVWIRYPQRYKGINTPVVAEPLPNNSQVQFLQLEDDGGMCGSDNKELRLSDFTLVRTAKNRVLRPIRVSLQQTERHLKAGRCGRLRGQSAHPLRQTCCGLCHPQRNRCGLCDLHMLILCTDCAIILENKYLCACF